MKVEIKSTNNYKLFKSINSNREINDPHVRNLIKAIKEKNLLPLNPIIVNTKMEIIDGQHRLEAAKILGYDIFYTISETITKNDIALLNSNKKNWKLIDYINFYTIEKKKGFDTLSKFISENPMMGTSTSLCLLSLEGGRNTKDLYNGLVDVSNEKKAWQVANICKEFFNIYDKAFSRDFVMAIKHCLETGKYEHLEMMKKVRLQPRSLVPCIDKQQCIQMIQDIYNYKSHNKVKFI